MKRPAVALGAALLLVLAAGCTAAPHTVASSPPESAAAVTLPSAYTPVTVEVLGSPTFPFKGSDGTYHVAYALQLTNATTVPATLKKVEVVDAAHRSRVLASFSGTALVDPSCEYGDCNRLRTLPSSPAPNAVIPPQQSRALLVDFTFSSLKNAPKVVLHRVFVDAAASPPAKDATPVSYLVAPKEVAAGVARVISPPLRGENWVAQNGCCGIGLPHVMSLLPLDGTLADSQRFAIDWMRTDDQGHFYSGDKTKNTSYHDYGEKIYAVADGTITSTLDNVDANAPGVLPATDPVLAKKITVENVDGNHIVEDIGGGQWAMYAHLQKGSLLVKPGDMVHAGQVIAKLGNTGNSNAPHLHFQLMNGPNLIGSDGLPYVFDRFEYAGYVDPHAIIAADDYVSGAFFAHHLATSQKRTKELPLNGSFVDFGP